MAVILMCILPVKTLEQTSDEQQQVSSQTSDEPQPDLAWTDSIEISLLTCEPVNQVWALYGHTALRFHDLRNGEDLAVNWGIFDFRKSFFVVRFTFGLTDYFMAMEPFQDFCNRYAYDNAGITEQVLNLTAQEKLKVIAALQENYKPENRMYRYNYFYDNCTTRARNIIEQCIDGQLQYNTESRHGATFRKEIHEWNVDHLWARWGNDFLLGVGSDMQTTRQEQQFLPDSLRHDFEQATITNADGTQRPLVKQTLHPVPPLHEAAPTTVWDTLTRPCVLAFLLFMFNIIIMLLEHRRKRKFWVWDSFLLTSSGILGLVLFLMIFSQHPTVSLNLQILFLNPLSLIMAIPVTIRLSRGQSHPYTAILAILTIIAIPLGLFLQTYAEGNIVLALLLLMRYGKDIRQLYAK